MRWILCLPSPNTRFRRCVTFGVVVTELEIEKSIVVTFPADGSLLRWAAVAVEEGEMGLTRGFGEGRTGDIKGTKSDVLVELLNLVLLLENRDIIRAV